MNKLNDDYRPHPKRTWLKTWLLAAALGAVLPQARALEPGAVLPDKDAYVHMLRADGHRDRGETAQALESYAEAIRLFREVQSFHPDYQASNIAFRLDYCVRQAELLRPPADTRSARAPLPVAELPVPPPAAPDVGPEAERQSSPRADLHRAELDAEQYRKLQSEYTNLRERMIRLQQAARELRDAVGRRNEDLMAAQLAAKTEREQRIRLETSLVELKEAAVAALEEAQGRETELTEARAAAAASAESVRAAEARTEALTAELEQARAAQARLEAAAESARTEDATAGKRLEEITAELEHARAAAAASAESVRTAEARTEALTAELEQARAAQSRLEAAAESARTEAATAGKRLEEITAELDAERNRIAEQNEKAAEELRRGQAEMDEIRQTAERLETQVETLTQERDHATAAIDTMRDELERAGTLAVELNQELELWQGRAREAAAAREAADGRRADAEQAATAARAEAQQHLDRIAVLEREIAKVADLAESVPTDIAPPPVTPDAAPTPEDPTPEAPAPEPEEMTPAPAAEPAADALADTRTLLRSGDVPGAYAQLQAFLKEDPHHQEALSDAAQCAYRLGLESEAIGYYQRLLAVRPDHARANFNLAVIYSLTKPPQIEQARSHYERARILGEPRDEKLERQLDR